MFDKPFELVAREWLDNAIAWDKGKDPDCEEYKPGYPFYWQWAGNPPDAKYYRPNWREETRTHYQMYETTSEGTPLSPVMESPEVLARWLTDNNASACGNEGASYEGWLRVCKGGYAPSMVINNGVLKSGVDGL